MSAPIHEYEYDKLTPEQIKHLTESTEMDSEFKINFIKWLDENYEFPNP
jgi:hypothetical protein